MMKLEVSRHVVAIPCFALLLTVLVGPPAIAQTIYGSIVGTAHDSRGAAIPGVRVRAVNQATGVNPEAYAFPAPGMGISGFQWAGPNAWQPSGATDINTQINDQFSITRGRHIVKIGADKSTEERERGFPLLVLSAYYRESAVAASWLIAIPINGRWCVPARPVGATGMEVHHDA
jgi:hypothetical protein